MTAEIDPPELARLLDTAERPRADEWSLRAALTRYAQPQPQRASDLIEVLRRIEFGLKPHSGVLDREGPAVWQALANGSAGSDGSDGSDADPYVVGLLRALMQIDVVGDDLAAWAVAREGERPDAAIDAVVADVRRQLEELGVPVEERPRPTGRRG